MQTNIEQMPEVARRLERLRDLDDSAHGALLAAVLCLGDNLKSEMELATLTDLVAQVAMEAPEAARVFADRIGVQPELIADTVGLRKWALHGLQQREGEERIVHHFEWSDPFAFSDQRTLNDSEHLLDRREGLQHYLAGYGTEDFAIELHQPMAQGIPQPRLKIADATIYVPRRVEVVELGQRDLLHRAMFAHAAAHLRYSPSARSVGNRRPTLIALTALIEDSRVERLMLLSYSGLHAVWARFHDASKEVSGFDLAGLMARLARALHDPAYEDSNAWVIKGRDLFEEAAAQDLRNVELFDRLARELALDVGKMHLTLPPHYRQLPIYRDDNTVLWREDEALPVDETRKPEISEIEFRSRDDMPEDKERDQDYDLRPHYRYPEWDYRLQDLRENWTTVIEDLPTQRSKTNGRPSSTYGRHKSLHGAQRVPDRSIRLTRLAEGDDLDLNAAIDNAIEQRAGFAPDGRIFLRHGRHPRSIGIIVLMDLSVSTDRFAPGSFTKVIDLVKQASTAVADALESEHNRVAIYGFASNGRHEVNYYCVKDFDEPFDGPRKKRLNALKSKLSTRMGAAIRHSTALLANEKVDNKVILLLTDGEPFDIDVIEEDYLIEEAHDAVVSAAAQRVRTFCLTLDRTADNYVRRIFGTRNYMISDRVSKFSENARNILLRMLAP